MRRHTPGRLALTALVKHLNWTQVSVFVSDFIASLSVEGRDLDRRAYPTIGQVGVKIGDVPHLDPAVRLAQWGLCAAPSCALNFPSRLGR